jgi:hypothetical protein
MNSNGDIYSNLPSVLFCIFEFETAPIRISRRIRSFDIHRVFYVTIQPMEHATPSVSAPSSAEVAPAANALVECLLRGGAPRELRSILAETPGIANRVDAQGS